MRKPRVCAVSYLNTVPLVWGMLHGNEKHLFELEFRLPSECAARLSAGTADIGLAPSIELDRQGLDPVPGVGIACRGAVRSILLVAKTPPDRIRTVAGDSSSRTSVALARIILARRYGAEPGVISMPPDVPAMLARCDAALVIGDPALRFEPESSPHLALDLGAEWLELTGLPMVFAMWGRRPGVRVSAGFAESCRFGRERLEEIVQREAPRRGVPLERAREYLSQHIVNEFGADEAAGLERFLEYARELAGVAAA